MIRNSRGALAAIGRLSRHAARRGTTGAMLLGALMMCTASAAEAAEFFASFKDDLFAYPPLSATRDGGRYTDVDYAEVRDINGRDEVPERRVRSAYVDLAPLRHQAESSVDTPAGPLPIMTVGHAATPSAIVLFIHGRNGDRRLGMNDRTFGGNFNRLKNLIDRAGGLYVTADAGRFDAPDRQRIASLVRQLAQRAPGAKLILACASMGGGLCWQIMGEADVARNVDGLIMLGASNDRAAFDAMAAVAGRPIPLMIAHGTRDQVSPFERQDGLYAAIRKARPDYPLRFVAFEGGTHGTPIRMIDWRETLNWIVGASSE
ncbi:hypothetical protein [Mangrovicella endophytica]|uniref:hypothetical protein n=1 Tax=Mangrovicella endophytica TaxID=2066697 RepID=UPI0012FFF96E|nr:hypothetical protein [Mangrovicella endophytica]